MSVPCLVKVHRWHHLAGLGLFLAHLALLLTLVKDVGVPRDESFYFFAADKAGDWVGGLFDSKVRSFSREEIDRGFAYNHEHPVLMKTLYGVSHKVLVDKLKWVKDNRLGYRMPALIMASLAIYLTFLLGVMFRGWIAGIGAALALSLMPHVAFHSSVACFDGPVTFMWLLICFTFVKATRSRAWALGSGVALGLGLATKLNVFFLPFVLLGVAAIDVYLFKKRTGSVRAPANERGPLTYYVWIAFSMLILGAVVFFAHWPYLYYDTYERLRFYIGFHAKHVHYPVDYLGTLYYKPPFPVHFPFVFSALTIPVATLLLVGLGAVVAVRRALLHGKAPDEERFALDWVIFANAFVPFAIIALPSTPIFGGTKHWMPAMPFLAVLAGVGLEKLVAELAAGWSVRGQAATAVALGVVCFAEPAWATLTYGHEGAAYFNALAGGPPGAAALRMPRNFWGYSTIEALPAINRLAEPKAQVFWHKATQWAIDAYRKDGLLRADVAYTGDWTAPYSNWAVYHDQLEKLPEELDIWRAYGTEWPVEGHFLDGVQLVGVYHRPAPPALPPIPPGGR